MTACARQGQPEGDRAALPAPDPPRAAAVAYLVLPKKPSIAVLAFENMSGDPSQDYFADGIVEDITTELSRFKELLVIARNSSFAYKGRAVDVRQIGRELGVRYVLEGSVRKAAARVRITGQLIDASSGAHLWADRFDGDLEDVFNLQDRITTSVVASIGPKLEQAEIERARENPPKASTPTTIICAGWRLLVSAQMRQIAQRSDCSRRRLNLTRNSLRRMRWPRGAPYGAG